MCVTIFKEREICCIGHHKEEKEAEEEVGVSYIMKTERENLC
jgi:hypothetical protein